MVVWLFALAVWAMALYTVIFGDWGWNPNIDPHSLLTRGVVYFIALAPLAILGLAIVFGSKPKKRKPTMGEWIAERAALNGRIREALNKSNGP